MLTDDGYRQLMKHAKRLAQEGHGELAQHLRDAIDLRAEVEALRADAATDRELVQAAFGEMAVHNLRLVLIEAMKANAKHAEIDAARAAQGDN